MVEPPATRQFPTQPCGARHLYAVARFDGLPAGGDPTDGFVLTRGYWDEADAQAQAEKMNRSVPVSRAFAVAGAGFEPATSGLWDMRCQVR